MLRSLFQHIPLAASLHMLLAFSLSLVMLPTSKAKQVVIGDDAELFNYYQRDRQEQKDQFFLFFSSHPHRIFPSSVSFISF